MREKQTDAGPSQRQLRVGELLRKALADLLVRSEIQDPDLDGVLVSVAEISVSPDLRNATAFVSPLGSGDGDKLVEALNRNRKFIRGVMARQVDLRYMPDIKFKNDVTLGRAERIDEILRSPKVVRDLD